MYSVDHAQIKGASTRTLFGHRRACLSNFRSMNEITNYWESLFCVNICQFNTSFHVQMKGVLKHYLIVLDMQLPIMNEAIIILHVNESHYLVPSCIL